MSLSQPYKLPTERPWVTEFVTVTVPQPESVAQVSQTILQALQALGTPLRWAITAVDPKEQSLFVEAVVIMPTPQNPKL